MAQRLQWMAVGLLFNRNIDHAQAVSGPLRIIPMIGGVAASSFQESFAVGLSATLNFLALISIALCMMNLLPIPIIDGGWIVLYLVEIIIRKPIHHKAVSAFQTAGVIIIAGLMIFAVRNDILFFITK